MDAHTFTVPPFFVTSGGHYLNYRKGSNIITTSLLSFSNKLHAYITERNDNITMDVE